MSKVLVGLVGLLIIVGLLVVVGAEHDLGRANANELQIVSRTAILWAKATSPSHSEAMVFEDRVKRKLGEQGHEELLRRVEAIRNECIKYSLPPNGFTKHDVETSYCAMKGWKYAKEQTGL